MPHGSNIGKHDAIHNTGSTQRVAVLPEEEWAMGIDVSLSKDNYITP